MKMPSATFDRVNVREIGLRSLIKSQIVGTLGRGGTSASFKTSGTLHILSEPSWEDCLLTALSFLATVASVTDKGSSSFEATRTFSDRGEYPCITLTKAPFICNFRSEYCRQGPNLDGGWF